VIEIRGDTYSVRAALKAIGGKLTREGDGWVWRFPNAMEAKVEALLHEMGVRYTSRFVPDTEEG